MRAIAQGSSEKNISAVIATADAGKALRTVHSSFILPHLSISLGLIGAGSIGGTFLKQLAAQSAELRAQRKIDVRVRAIADPRKCCWRRTKFLWTAGANSSRAWRSPWI